MNTSEYNNSRRESFNALTNDTITWYNVKLSKKKKIETECVEHIIKVNKVLENGSTKQFYLALMKNEIYEYITSKKRECIISYNSTLRSSTIELVFGKTQECPVDNSSDPHDCPGGATFLVTIDCFNRFVLAQVLN